LRVSTADLAGQVEETSANTLKGSFQVLKCKLLYCVKEKKSAVCADEETKRPKKANRLKNADVLRSSV
jgi:hypothetical protein